MLKKIISAILMLSMLLTAFACLTACNNGGENNNGGGGSNGGEDAKVNYVVTVSDQNGNAVIGAKVTLTTSAGIPIALTTGIDGTVSYSTKDTITATITELPLGYEYGKLGQAQGFDEGGALSVTVEALDPLVIKVIDNEGNPIAGVTVQMCDTTCRIPVTTNDEGIATYPYEDGDFHAQLTGGNVPEGYTVEDPEAYYPFVDGVATITLTKVEE